MAKIELPSLRELRRSKPDRLRCGCGQYIGNSNLAGSGGRFSDAWRRGALVCENCNRKFEGAI